MKKKRVQIYGRIKKHIFHLTGLFKIAKINRIDVIHVLNPILIRKSSFPLIVTVHDLAELHIKKYNIFRQYYRVFTTYLSSKYSDEIISVSENTKTDLVTKFNIKPEKINTIYPSYGIIPIENATYKEVNKQIKKKYFLFVGKYLPHKNLITLLNAFILLNSRHNCKDVQLVIVGEGNKKLVSKMNYALKDIQENIIVLGYVSNTELQVTYKNAFCFVMPSIYEGFGLPLIEAMSYNLPIICSNSSCLPEITSGKVLYHDPMDTDKLELQMLRILNDKNLVKNMTLSYKDILNKYTWVNTSKKTHKIYKRLSSG